MPLFHSTSTGTFPSQTIEQFQQVTDFTLAAMGGAGSPPSPFSSSSSLTSSAEVNVAYDGTFADLGADSMSYDGFDYSPYLTAESGFTAIDSGATNGATVSPKDVFNTDSVPPSTSFTNLTTPGSTYLETPDDDYQTSPLFGDNLAADSHTGADGWYSLFPDSDTNTVAGAVNPAPLMTRTTSSSSGNQIVVHPGGESRKRSSTTASPAMFSPAVKHSSVAGVAARKRDKPLPPIMVDENDTVALKRARNTAAARKSRAKKVAERDELEAEIADLKAQVDHWKALALGHAANQESDEE